MLCAKDHERFGASALWPPEIGHVFQWLETGMMDLPAWEWRKNKLGQSIEVRLQKGACEFVALDPPNMCEWCVGVNFAHAVTCYPSSDSVILMGYVDK